MDERKLEISVKCVICPATHSSIVYIKNPISMLHDGIDIEDGLCEKHKDIKDFINSQCPGCVGGWGQCDLWRSFAFGSMEIKKDALDEIANGICPYRTNGSLIVNLKDKSIEESDLGEIAPEKSGQALVDAIYEYCHRYY